MPSGMNVALSKLFADRVHVRVTGAKSLKPYENSITLVASSVGYNVQLPHPSDAADRIFTAQLLAYSSGGAINLQKPAGHTVSTVAALQYTANRAVLYSDGADYFVLAATTSSS